MRSPPGIMRTLRSGMRTLRLSSIQFYRSFALICLAWTGMPLPHFFLFLSFFHYLSPLSLFLFFIIYFLFTYLLLVFFDLSIYKLLFMNEELKDVCKKQNNNAALGIRLPLLSLPSPPFFIFIFYIFIYCYNILMNHKLRNI